MPDSQYCFSLSSQSHHTEHSVTEQKNRPLSLSTDPQPFNSLSLPLSAQPGLLLCKLGPLAVRPGGDRHQPPASSLLRGDSVEGKSCSLKEDRSVPWLGRTRGGDPDLGPYGLLDGRLSSHLPCEAASLGRTHCPVSQVSHALQGWASSVEEDHRTTSQGNNDWRVPGRGVRDDEAAQMQERVG